MEGIEVVKVGVKNGEEITILNAKRKEIIRMSEKAFCLMVGQSIRYEALVAKGKAEKSIIETTPVKNKTKKETFAKASKLVDEAIELVKDFNKKVDSKTTLGDNTDEWKVLK